MSEVVLFWDKPEVVQREDTLEVTVATERLELTHANRGGDATVFRQGPPGRSLAFDWQGRSLGVGYAGQALEYRDLGRAFGASGWALWRDQSYSDQNPPLLLNGVEELSLDASSVLEYAPEDAVGWSSGSDLFPTAEGQAYLLRVAMTALPLVAERELGFEMFLYDGPVIYGEQTELSKGAGTPQRVAFQALVYSGADMVRDGAYMRLTSDGPVELYDFTTLIVRLVE